MSKKPNIVARYLDAAERLPVPMEIAAIMLPITTISIGIPLAIVAISQYINVWPILAGIFTYFLIYSMYRTIKEMNNDKPL